MGGQTGDSNIPLNQILFSCSQKFKSALSTHKETSNDAEKYSEEVQDVKNIPY